MPSVRPAKVLASAEVNGLALAEGLARGGLSRITSTGVSKTASRLRLEGHKLGPVVLRCPLGQGGFAPVWLANETFGKKKLRDVAVKLFFLPTELPQGSAEAEAWYDAIGEEAHALCRIDHSAVVRLHSVQRDDVLNLVGLVMEYIPGPNLEELLLRQGPLDEQSVVDVGANIAWALSAVHSAGLIHRDVKPSNIIRGPTGYRLIDFGIFASNHAREKISADQPAFDSEFTSPMPTLAGTHGYIAPECWQGNATPQPSHDVYALGATLFRLLTGSFPPPVGRDVSPPSVLIRAGGIRASSALLDLVDQLMAADPFARPRHAEAIARQLERLASAHGTSIAGTNGMQATLTHSMADRFSGPSHDAIPVEMWPLVGRESVRTTLGRALEGATNAVTHFILLTGPMGIGRSRLVDLVVKQAQAKSWHVLTARCAPERHGPLRPFLDALSALDNHSLEFGALIDAVERALPMMSLEEREGSSPGLLDPAAPVLHRGALDELEQALLDASVNSPLLLALDDLQWADASTLSLLVRLVARAGTKGRLFVLGAIRDEPRPEPTLAALLTRAGLSARPELQRLRLRPLSDDEATQVLRDAGQCSAELAAIVSRGAGGIPALMAHALSALREFGMVQLRAGIWHAIDERASVYQIPGAPELLAAQLASYFPAGHDELARRILSCVALHGGGLDRALLAAIWAGNAEFEETLDVLVNTNILTFAPERQELGFAQEMVRQAALNLTRRHGWFDEMHRALLDMIAAQKSKSVDAIFLAAGYERLGDDRNARLWLKRGIRAAIASGLFEEAILLGDRLAALASTSRARQQIALDSVRCAILGRLFDDARRRLDKLPSGLGLSSAFDIERRICHLEIARGIGAQGVEDQLLIADADQLGDSVLRCEARLAVAGVLPPDEGFRLATEAVELASSCGRGVEFAARVRRLEINRARNHRDSAMAHEDVRRSLAIATAAGSVFQRIHVEGDWAILESDVGQTAAAISRLERLAEEARTRRMLGQERLLLQNLSALLLRTDRNDEAAEASKRAAKLGFDAGDLGLAGRALSVRADALRKTGQLAAALSCVDEALVVQEQIRDPRRALTLLRRAEIREALGDAEGALSDAQAARPIAEAMNDLDLTASARLSIALRRARMGNIAAEQINELLVEVDAMTFKRGPMTIRLREELSTWLKVQWIEGGRDLKGPVTVR